MKLLDDVCFGIIFMQSIEETQTSATTRYWVCEIDYSNHWPFACSDHQSKEKKLKMCLQLRLGIFL